LCSGSAPSVHELVDDLCKKAVGLCAGGEILGIAVAFPCPLLGFHLGEYHSHPVHK